jgi:hypothetical protein
MNLEEEVNGDQLTVSLMTGNWSLVEEGAIQLTFPG